MAGPARSLKLETERGKYRITSNSILDIELVKPPAAQSHFLLVDLKRIGQQRPDPCDAAPKGTDTVSGAVVAGYLLIKISAHPGRQANWKMLVERRLDMKLVAALVVRRGIAQIKCHASRGRDFGACLGTEKSISPFDIDARPVEAHYGETVRGVVSGRGETRQRDVPMMLACFPAETHAIGAISDGDCRIRPVELAIEPPRGR